MTARSAPTSSELAGRVLIASGLLAAAGVVLLTAMFVSFAVGATSSALAFGRVNDVLVLVSYALAIPGVLAIHAMLRPRFRGWADVLAIVGIAAIVTIVVLQALLVTAVLTFEQQVGPVSLALLVLGGWFVLTGYLGSSIGALPRGTRMGLLAATYVGYPVWALWLGGRLRSGPGVRATSEPAHP